MFWEVLDLYQIDGFWSRHQLVDSIMAIHSPFKRDPIVQVKRLASFLEWSFNNEGEIDEVTWRCSLERHKDLEVNKDGERV
jgi:hypothetical protein